MVLFVGLKYCSVQLKIALREVVPSQMAGHPAAGYKGELTLVELLLGARRCARCLTYSN